MVEAVDGAKWFKVVVSTLLSDRPPARPVEFQCLGVDGAKWVVEAVDGAKWFTVVVSTLKTHGPMPAG